MHNLQSLGRSKPSRTKNSHFGKKHLTKIRNKIMYVFRQLKKALTFKKLIEEIRKHMPSALDQKIKYAINDLLANKLLQKADEKFHMVTS